MSSPNDRYRKYGGAALARGACARATRHRSLIIDRSVRPWSERRIVGEAQPWISKRVWRVRPAKHSKWRKETKWAT